MGLEIFVQVYWTLCGDMETAPTLFYVVVTS